MARTPNDTDLTGYVTESGSETLTNKTITSPVISNATASTIAGYDGSKVLGSLATATYPSLAELAHVKGVTSAIQTQIDAKAPSASPTFTGTVTETNSTDNNNVQVSILQGDRATYTANDAAYESLQLSDDAGTQVEVARIRWAIPTVTAGAVSGRLDFAVRTAGTLANELQLSGADLSPSTNDGLSLGTASLQYSDLFLASGAVMDWGGNNVILTQTSGVLTLGTGTLKITTPTNTSTSVVTVDGTQTLTNKRVTQRVVTTTDDATAVIDVDVTDTYELSAIANNTTFTLTGTPTDGQKLVVRYKDAGVSKTLTWTGFTALGITLPANTTAGKWGYVGVIYNAAASQYHAVSVTTEA